METSSPDDSNENIDAEHSLMSVYKKLVENYGWSLNQIDETDIETLVEFIFFNRNDPDIRVINGKEYHRAKGAPSWL